MKKKESCLKKLYVFLQAWSKCFNAHPNQAQNKFEHRKNCVEDETNKNSCPISQYQDSESNESTFFGETCFTLTSSHCLTHRRKQLWHPGRMDKNRHKTECRLFCIREGSWQEEVFKISALCFLIAGGKERADFRMNTTSENLFTTENLESSTSPPAKTGTLTKPEFIFYAVVRGALYCVVQIVATFLNVSTLIAISKHRNLQVTSNGLVMCLSAGHSLAIIAGTLVVFTDFILENALMTWKVVCSVLIFFLTFQQTVNYVSVMAISIERTYTIFFPMHAYRNNSFGRMQKLAFWLLGYALVHTSVEIGLGFNFGNFQYTTWCIFRTVAGPLVTVYGILMTLLLSSITSFFMTSIILLKLVCLRRQRRTEDSTKLSNSQYKITKMLATGRCSSISIVSVLTILRRLVCFLPATTQ